MSDIPLLDNSTIKLELDLKPTVPPSRAQWPSITTAQRLAVLYDDELQGVARSTLFDVLGRFGVSEQSCYINAARNEANNTAEILRDLGVFQPHCVLLVGLTPLRVFNQSAELSIGSWRGSLFRSRSGFKCIACEHPFDVFKDYEQMPLLRMDLARAAEEAKHPLLVLPERIFELDVDASRACALLNSLQVGTLTSLDIEGGVAGLKCISFSQHPLSGFIIPWQSYSLEEQCQVGRVLARVLRDPTIPKVLQNSLYDNFVLSYVYRMPIRGVVHDTMLSGWEIYPELPKALDVQASIWTREPYYKLGRKTSDIRILHDYCCRDSAVTLEIAAAHAANFAFNPHSAAHYQFNRNMLAPLLYLELRGIAYRKDAAIAAHVETCVEQEQLQKEVEAKTGPININSPVQLCKALYDKLHYAVQHPKVGRKIDHTKRTTNIDAMLNLFKITPNDPLITAILRWRKLDKLRQTLSVGTDPDGRVRCAYNLVGTVTGRMACYESPTGSGTNLQTITERLRYLYRADDGYDFFQCDLSGADGWTVAAHCNRLGDPTMLSDYKAGLKPAKLIVLMMRHGVEVNTYDHDTLLKMSEEVSEKGEDGWIYFACKRVQHGSNYGLKPPKMSEQILKDSYNKMQKTIYLSPTECSVLQRLYNTRYPGVRYWQEWVRNQILHKGQLSCASGHVRTFFGRRDAVSTLNDALSHEPQANTTYATNLAVYRLWTDPENRERHPYGCPSRPEGAGFLSETDSRAIRENLIIQPLHQVHDAVCGQFPTARREWAIDRIRSYFANTITIADQPICIPFGGGYGPDWGTLPNKF